MGERELEEQLDQLREELETMQDDYEDKLDTLTTQFEDKIDSLEDIRDKHEEEIERLKESIQKIKSDNAMTMKEIEEAHTKELEDLRYSLATSGAEWVQEVDEEGNQFYRNSITGETRWEDPTPLNAAGRAAIEKLENVESELMTLRKKDKKSRVTEKAMANQIDTVKRSLTEAKNETGLLELKLQQSESKEELLVLSHEQNLERKREEKERVMMLHEETRTKQIIEANAIRVRLAESRREAKHIIDDMKSDIQGMQDMQRRAMGIHVRPRR
jgi:chromosome segregation ATPase